ncbi:hypothetical protein DID99_08600 [Burkholderia sp. Bp8986]|nr:hypothetical protein DID99_08600 [Burkholderia sp. Bp8986]
MAAAVYTISSSPPVRRSHGNPSGDRVAPGGLATEPACAGPHIRHARSVPFERSGVAACFKAATRPPGCRTRNLRPGAGFTRKITVLAAKSAFARPRGNSHV